MSDFTSDLASPRWWMSVVIAGIVVNVIATYIMRALDTRLERASGWWKTRQGRRRAELLAEARELRNRDDAYKWLMTVEIRQRFHSLVALVQAIGAGLLFVLFVSVGVPTWLGFFAVVLFSVLWYAFVRQCRLAERAASLAELVRHDQNAG